LTQYSHSRLSSFENCPQKFEYRYIQKIQVESEGIEAFLGKRVHEILERLYHHVARHRRPPTLGQVKDRFHEDWKRHWHEHIKIVRRENSTEVYLQQGERCLENYYRGHYPFEDGETVALEKHVSLQLDDAGNYRARGVIDRLTKQKDGTYEIHDYKTSSSLPPPARLERDRQLALYQIGIEQSFPDAESIELVWHYLVFNKTLRSRRTPQQLDELRSRTIQLIDEIEANTSFQPKPGPLCRWCEYRDLCPEGPASPSREESEPADPELAPAAFGASTAALCSPEGIQLSLLD